MIQTSGCRQGLTGRMGRDRELGSWLRGCWACVVETKFVCPMNSEAKQTETPELGAEKIYCRAKQGEWVAHAQKAQTP